jgi:hypothetical protein
MNDISLNQPKNTDVTPSVRAPESIHMEKTIIRDYAN